MYVSWLWGTPGPEREPRGRGGSVQSGVSWGGGPGPEALCGVRPLRWYTCLLFQVEEEEESGIRTGKQTKKRNQKDSVSKFVLEVDITA